MSVAIEIVNACYSPAWVHLAWRQIDRAHLSRAVHEPNRKPATVVLPQQVGLRIPVEISRSHQVPARVNLCRSKPHWGGGSSVHEPDGNGAIGVLPQDIFFAVMV